MRFGKYAFVSFGNFLVEGQRLVFNEKHWVAQLF